MRGWWSNRGGAERFDLYTRASLYLILVAFLVVAAVMVGGEQPPDNTAAAVTSLVVLTAATVVGIRAFVQGLDQTLHGGGSTVPRRLLWVYVALMVIAGAAGYVGYGAAGPEHPGAFPGIAVLIVHVVAVLSSVLPWTRLALVGLALAVVVSGLAAVAGSPTASVFAVAWAVVFGSFGVIGGFRGSVWMLQIVWELDRSRKVEAELAVAEERLRFARDLHDVMGRNLSVIALRSDLAAELARRGRVQEGADEMLGVRAVAQDSLREMREVVHGYRAVDLAAELAGARSVLRAAGTSTKVIGDAEALHAEAQAVLSWVVREATTNVIRHSEAGTCTFRVAEHDGSAVLTITNDGVRHSDPGSGSGLSGLSERLAATDGVLDVSHDPDSATFTLRAQLPLRGADREPTPVATGAST